MCKKLHPRRGQHPGERFLLGCEIQFLFSVSVIQLSQSENLQTTLESDWIRRMSQNNAVAIRELPTVFSILYSNLALRWYFGAHSSQLH